MSAAGPRDPVCPGGRWRLSRFLRRTAAVHAAAGPVKLADARSRSV